MTAIYLEMVLHDLHEGVSRPETEEGQGVDRAPVDVIQPSQQKRLEGLDHDNLIRQTLDLMKKEANKGLLATDPTCSIEDEGE